MKFRDAVNCCKVRGYIARPNGYHADCDSCSPDFKYWKNHPVLLENRVAIQDQVEHDWEVFDPEGEETSIIA